MKWIKHFIIQYVGCIIPDKIWIEIMYIIHLHKLPNLKNPSTFNEKLQWLKLYYHKPEHTKLVDKYEMKKYVSDIAGNDLVVPVIGIWENVDDIDFDVLPQQFVLKVTHDSGGVIICKDKTQLDRDKTRQILRGLLHTNYFKQYREWPYKNVKPRVFAEKYIEDYTGSQLRDYKVFCFNGIPYCIQVDFDRFTDHKKNLYDVNWNLLDFSFNYPAHPEIKIEKPQSLNKMLDIAIKLSNGEPYVRIDFYIANDALYVGEITFFPASGFGKFIPEEYDKILGDKISLPQKQL